MSWPPSTPGGRRRGVADMADAPMANPIVEPLLTYREAGKLLGVTERTIWTLVQQGELPAVRFGRSVRIDPADLRPTSTAARWWFLEMGASHERSDRSTPPRPGSIGS